MANVQSSRRAALRDIVLPVQPNQSGQNNNQALDATKGVHVGLWFDKYITSVEREQGGSQKSEQPKPRQELVRQVAGLPIPAIYKKFYTRWTEYLDAMGTKKHIFAVKKHNRMVIGLGNESVLETSVTLHRTYGVPYIPGSALKGLAASYARLMAGDDWRQGSIAYETVFGNTDNAGFVTFFDALYIPESAPPEQPDPANQPEKEEQPLHADIITVHHPNYYKGADASGKIAAAPADWDSPTPIPFLSATGHYLVALAAPDIDSDNRDLWLAKVFELLEQALLILGIGAKTSSGYGRMEYVEVVNKTSQAETKAIESLTREISSVKDVPSQMYGYYQRWKQFSAKEVRRIVAQAIVDRIAEANREKWASTRGWYQELQSFLSTPEP